MKEPDRSDEWMGERPDEPSMKLTRYARQMKVQDLIARGIHPKEIAARFGVSEATIYRDMQTIGSVVSAYVAEDLNEDQKRGFALQMLNAGEVIAQTVAGIGHQMNLYFQFLVDEGANGKPRIDKEVHRMIGELRADVGRFVELNEKIVGNLAVAPTLIQNNTTVTNNEFNANPELDALRQKWLEAKESKQTMDDMYKMQAEGEAEHSDEEE